MNTELLDEILEELQKQIHRASLTVVKELPKFKNNTPPREATGRIMQVGPKSEIGATYRMDIGVNKKDCNGVSGPFEWANSSYHIGYLEIEHSDIRLDFNEPNSQPGRLPKVIKSFAIHTDYISRDIKRSFKEALKDERLTIGVLARKLSV